MLNAKAKQQQITNAVNQIRYDIEIAYQQLASKVQSDSAFTVKFQELALIPVKDVAIETEPGFEIFKMQSAYQDALLQVERNRLLPDLSLSYFNGTNQYSGAKRYQGFQFGLGLPLFFGEQRAKIKASQIALSINSEMQSQYLSSLLSRKAELRSELLKYKETIDFYQTSGKDLSNQIITSSQKSYEMGEIDFYRFVLSIENALEMNVNYYDNVAKYNQVALEINYLTN
jgi:cobalt-zinc-cadmium resistance protein CzcA